MVFILSAVYLSLTVSGEWTLSRGSVNSLFLVKAYCLLRKWSLLYVGRFHCECHFFVDAFFFEHDAFFVYSLCLVNGLFIANGLFFMRGIRR